VIVLRLGHDVGHVLAQFLAACASATLPAVSWIVAPYAYSEHPAARPVDGAAYVQTVLNAIWAQPEQWAKTAIFINYDEHDGFFDHVISPTAPYGTRDEFVRGLPVGLGPRAPMTVVSPWSRGGWINSQVFDHTSVLRFLELWTGVKEPNISRWRRDICGDLTSCFDFAKHDATVPVLPDTAALRKQAAARVSKLPVPTPPAPGRQLIPHQEPGAAAARALPYQPWANARRGPTAIRLVLGNRGTAALQLQIYDRVTHSRGRRIDIAAGGTASAVVAAAGRYDLVVHGPNGFLREIAGTSATNGLDVVVKVIGPTYHPQLSLRFTNTRHSSAVALITGVGQGQRRFTIAPGTHTLVADPIVVAHGWYDISVRLHGHHRYLRRFAGHLENGRNSITG